MPLMIRAMLTAMLLLGFAGAATAQTWVSVMPEGTTTVHLARSGQREVRIQITAVRVKAADPLFPVGDSFQGVSEVSIVKDLRITVGSDEAFVFRSAFADLVNPTTADLRADGKNYVLTIGCRDAAEAFRAEISFSAANVTRRRIFSSLTPREASEDTRYTLTIFGQ